MHLSASSSPKSIFMLSVRWWYWVCFNYGCSEGGGKVMYDKWWIEGEKKKKKANIRVNVVYCLLWQCVCFLCPNLNRDPRSFKPKARGCCYYRYSLFTLVAHVQRSAHLVSKRRISWYHFKTFDRTWGRVPQGVSGMGQVLILDCGSNLWAWCPLSWLRLYKLSSFCQTWFGFVLTSTGSLSALSSCKFGWVLTGCRCSIQHIAIIRYCVRSYANSVDIKAVVRTASSTWARRIFFKKIYS